MYTNRLVLLLPRSGQACSTSMVLHLPRSKRALYPRARDECDWATHSGFLNLGLPTGCILLRQQAGRRRRSGPRSAPASWVLAQKERRLSLPAVASWYRRLFDGGLGRLLVACHLHIRRAWWHRTSFDDNVCLFREALRCPMIRCR